MSSNLHRSSSGSDSGLPSVKRVLKEDHKVTPELIPQLITDHDYATVTLPRRHASYDDFLERLAAKGNPQPPVQKNYHDSIMDIPYSYGNIELQNDTHMPKYAPEPVKKLPLQIREVVFENSGQIRPLAEIIDKALWQKSFFEHKSFDYHAHLQKQNREQIGANFTDFIIHHQKQDLSQEQFTQKIVDQSNQDKNLSQLALEALQEPGSSSFVFNYGSVGQSQPTVDNRYIPSPEQVKTQSIVSSDKTALPVGRRPENRFLSFDLNRNTPHEVIELRNTPIIGDALKIISDQYFGQNPQRTVQVVLVSEKDEQKAIRDSIASVKHSITTMNPQAYSDLEAKLHTMPFHQLKPQLDLYYRQQHALIEALCRHQQLDIPEFSREERALKVKQYWIDAFQQTFPVFGSHGEHLPTQLDYRHWRQHFVQQRGDAEENLAVGREYMAQKNAAVKSHFFQSRSTRALSSESAALLLNESPFQSNATSSPQKFLSTTGPPSTSSFWAWLTSLFSPEQVHTRIDQPNLNTFPIAAEATLIDAVIRQEFQNWQSGRRDLDIENSSLDPTASSSMTAFLSSQSQQTSSPTTIPSSNMTTAESSPSVASISPHTQSALGSFFPFFTSPAFAPPRSHAPSDSPLSAVLGPTQAPSQIPTSRERAILLLQHLHSAQNSSIDMTSPLGKTIDQIGRLEQLASLPNLSFSLRAQIRLHQEQAFELYRQLKTASESDIHYIGVQQTIEAERQDMARRAQIYASPTSAPHASISSSPSVSSQQPHHLATTIPSSSLLPPSPPSTTQFLLQQGNLSSANQSRQLSLNDFPHLGKYSAQHVSPSYSSQQQHQEPPQQQPILTRSEQYDQLASTPRFVRPEGSSYTPVAHRFDRNSPLLKANWAPNDDHFGPCDSQQQTFQNCMTDSSNDLLACKPYHRYLKQCQKTAAEIIHQKSPKHSLHLPFVMMDRTL